MKLLEPEESSMELRKFLKVFARFLPPCENKEDTEKMLKCEHIMVQSDENHMFFKCCDCVLWTDPYYMNEFFRHPEKQKEIMENMEKENQ